MSRDRIEALRSKMNCAKSAIRRDACGDWMLTGRNGHAYVDGQNWLIYLRFTDSPRRWNNAKRKLGLFVSQDGDDEGCLRLPFDFPPTITGGLRALLGVRQSKVLSDSQKANLAKIGFQRAS